MKAKFLVWLLMSFIVFPVLSFAQMKPQISPQVKIAKTYWCAEVQNILFSNEPQQGQKLTVGVRVKLTKKTIIPGTPGQKLCNCAFEGPSDAPAKFWSKTMSLRLIGVKYSETETNLLEYYGPTPAFPPYDYGGFPVIGFVVTENDLKKGYIDVWGWASKEPLQCRDSAIYASLAVYNQSPYNQQNECHPYPDFKKSFKPKCLQVPKTPEGAVKKGAVLQIAPERFSFQKLTPIKFLPFARSEFQKAIRIRNGQEFITLKNGKTIPFDKFLKEVNEIEEKLNNAGYTLRDRTPVRIRYIYPLDKLNLQKGLFLKQFSLAPLHPENPCQSTSSSTKSQQDAGCPKDFIPLNWERAWDTSFGNEDFGVNLGASIKIKGEKEYVDIKELDGKPGFFWTDIKFFGKNIRLLLVDKHESELEAKWLDGIEVLGGKKTLSLSGNQKITLFNEGIKYSQEVSFPIGPIEVTGEFGFKGRAKLDINADYSIDSHNATLVLNPYLLAKAYGQLGVGYEIVEVGVEGDLTLIEASPRVVGSIRYIGSPNPSFQYTAEAINDLTLLKGSLSVYAEIDYWLDSKKFELEFFKWDGISLKNQPLFYASVQNEPAEKCHRAWLKIEDIRGITPYGARNDKLEVEPIEFDVIVNIEGRSYVKTLKDFNRDGVYGKTWGEVPFSFDIPLLSSEKVPITIEVKEKYNIGTLDFQSDLDFAKGETKKVELCYDPDTRSFSGSVSGKEEDETVASGDTSYWGERHHAIRFKITSENPFKAAPSKAK